MKKRDIKSGASGMSLPLYFTRPQPLVVGGQGSLDPAVFMILFGGPLSLMLDAIAIPERLTKLSSCEMFSCKNTIPGIKIYQAYLVVVAREISINLEM